MRTTIDIPDETYRRLKVKAALQGESLREIALRALRREIDAASEAPLPRLTEPILEPHQPGSIRIDNEQIYDLIGFP
jgi:plasmid stability protein